MYDWSYLQRRHYKKGFNRGRSGQSLRLLPYQLFLFIYPERDKKKNLPVSQIGTVEV